MRIAAAALFVLVCCFRGLSQTGFQKDLDALDKILKTTPSYRDQIKGERLKSYEATFQRLRSDTDSVRNFTADFYKLAQLFFPIHDNHLGFYQFIEKYLTKDDLKDVLTVQRFNESEFSRSYPSVSLNLDSLQAILKSSPKDSVEGIYYYDNYLAVAVYRTAKRDELIGVVTNSSLPHWSAGQIAIRLYEYYPNYFRAVYGHPLYKALYLYSNEKFRNHSLINSFFYNSFTESVYTKNPAAKDYTTLPRSEPDFKLKAINNHIQYLRLGNFDANTSSMKVSDSFYSAIKDSVKAPHLILDLRDNSGGARKVSSKFLRLIRNYANTGKVYVLINNGTMSQGEMFTLSLKEINNIKVYGQTTRGTIAYGVNTGKINRLPSQRYGVTATDMRDDGNYYRFESYGIDPDISFQNDGDWIEKIVAIIDDNGL